MKKLIELVKQRWKNILLLVTLGHFVFFIFQNRDIADLNIWERNTCYFKTHRELLDMDCRYYHVKRFVFAQPNLAYGETLKCKQASADKVKKFDQEVLAAECPAQDTWGSPKKVWDLGWDAYSIWYGRSVALYFQSQNASWPGLLRAINDPVFVQSFANIEHHHYPWLLSVFYFSLMKLVASPNPLPLIILQVIVWVLCAYLLFLIWPTCPLYAWILFAFVPTSGAFMFRLYADIWVVLFGLFMLLFLQTRRNFLAGIAFFLGCLLKQEAFIQLGALAVTFHLINFNNLKSIFMAKQRSFWILAVLAISMVIFNSHKFESKEFYFPLLSRLAELSFYTKLLPQILGYYADVFFRPAMWGLGPIWLICVFARSIKIISWKVYIPLMMVLVMIPLAYARYRFGYKEVILTGAGRALWQTMPLLWLLLKNVHEKTSQA